MECAFCNVPYDDVYAGVKPIDAMLHAIRTALHDPVQPARHVLISGGTPGPPHVPALREVYSRVLEEFADVGVDIMMVPVEGLFDLPKLAELGVNQLSINLELWDEGLASTLMRHKHRQGRQHYLDFLELAAEEARRFPCAFDDDGGNRAAGQHPRGSGSDCPAGVRSGPQPIPAGPSHTHGKRTSSGG